ncbi:MarR family transcriptional regulator [Candidatus Hydrogenisulfobacillus filiaventi]|uniref:MarR family transcriptional regulator n=1 Tax=Candidatus Hydrogenisulfobacillus filiaventi TaxID=2707344 RepID=A0A6F8ZF72_9FIRM|nr:MarR family transcriptional regulator [Bacillota bacterium]CAB1128344.1 MarR family transcriptional regulator [Candidatus Hydrogenisulfobacillus filiaventi]
MRLGRRLRWAFPDEGLTMAQFALLKLVDAHGPLTMGELADQLGVSLATATGLVDRLTAANLLTRERAERDRRVVVVRLSESGQARMAQAQARRRAYMASALRHLGTGDLEIFLRLLTQITEGVERDGHGAGEAPHPGKEG